MLKQILLLPFLLFTIANTFAQTEPGLVAYYPLDGNTNDSSGNNNNGTIIGGVTPTTDRFGNPNGAYHFDGSTGYISCPNDSQLLLSKNFSYSVWFRVENRPSGYQQNVILSNIGAYMASGGFEAVTNNPPGTYASLFRNGAYQDQVLGGNDSIQPDVWYNLIVVTQYDSISDSTTVSNYLDNAFDNSAKFPGRISYHAIDNFFIGANYDITNNDQRYFLGDIDDVKIYNIPLVLCSNSYNQSVNLACGDSFLFGGTTYYYSTIQTDTFLTAQGCDSIVTLNLSIVDTIYQADSICAGDTFSFEGNKLDSSGIYVGYRPGNNQCDSVTILTLTVNPLTTVIFTWDSLRALDDVSWEQFANSDTGGWCNLFYPPSFLLTGGTPIGGYYSGSQVSNDTLYPGGNLDTYGTSDTIYYTYSDSNHCSKTVSAILVGIFCDGVQQISGVNVMQVHPNPARDQLMVEYDGLNKSNKLEVFDVMGRMVITQEVTGGMTKVEMDTHTLCNGLYFLRIWNGGTTQAGAKFVIAR